MLQGKVIDADGHILEPPDLWQRYLENKYKDRAIRMEKDQDGVEYFLIDGRPSANLRGVGPAVGGAGFQEALRYLHLPAAKRHLQCSSWGAVTSLEEVLDQHVEERRLLRLIT